MSEGLVAPLLPLALAVVPPSGPGFGSAMFLFGLANGTEAPPPDDQGIAPHYIPTFRPRRR